MDLAKAIHGRRSVRIFQEKKVPKKLLYEIIDMARWAPSHCNTQNTRFIIVDNQKIKQRIVDDGGSVIIAKAPQAILVLYKNASDNVEYKDNLQSAAAAIQNMILYAYTKGLGTCWVCHLPRKKTMRKIFGIPKYFDPIAYILIGYPMRDQMVVPRKHEVEEIIARNKFGFKCEKKESERLALQTFQRQKLIMRRIVRRIYYFMPCWMKKRINRFVDKNYVKKFEN